ncbi:MAG: hypothetical protein ACI8X5_000604 [Planctomycetota bacterium]
MAANCVDIAGGFQAHPKFPMKAPLIAVCGLALAGSAYFLFSGPSSNGSEEPRSTQDLKPELRVPEGSSRQVLDSTLAHHSEERVELETEGSSEPAVLPTNITSNRPSPKELEAIRAENIAKREIAVGKQIRERSVRIADEIGLGTDAHKKIAEVYLAGRARLASFQAEFAEGLPTRTARTLLRDNIEGMKDWHREEFSKLFGSRAAKAIEEFRDVSAPDAAGLKRTD